MKKFGIKPGGYDELIVGRSYPGYLDLSKVVEDFLDFQGYPLLTSHIRGGKCEERFYMQKFRLRKKKEKY